MIEIVNAAISTCELERRWTLVRQAMRRQDISLLLLHSSNEYMHGYIRYLTDMPAFGYPVTLIVPVVGDMVLIGHGAIGGDTLSDPSDVRHRGVGRVLSCSTFATAHYTLAYEADQVMRAMDPYMDQRIGVIGAQAMASSIYERVRLALRSGGSLLDASDILDGIKAVRSVEEIDAARRTAALQDDAMAAVLRAIRPGMREREIVAVAEMAVRSGGGEEGVYLSSSGPIGSAAPLRPPHFQERVLRDGDAFHLLIETNGPGGIYTELGRTIVLGEPTAKMREQFNFALEARRFTLERLLPGASPALVWDAYNKFMVEHGRPAEDRLFCHGQGYDLVERPLIRFDETMEIGQNMIIACHPTWRDSHGFHWICDSYLIQGNQPERLHATPEALLATSAE